MRTLISKMKNSDFLSSGELLKLKVSLVLIFLFFFSVLTIPISIFEDFTIEFKIIMPISFLFMFFLSLLMLLTNRIRSAMHLSIFTFIGLSVYYITAANLLYGYFLIFITLTIIIFFQDIYTYLLYGGTLTIYGVYYIAVNGNQLMNINEANLLISNTIYQSILIGFFLVFLIYFILSDSMQDKLRLDFLKVNNTVEKYRENCLKYVDDIMDKEGVIPTYENYKFQKAVSEMAIFINEFFEKNGANIAEVVEFYFFIHNYTIDQIMENTKINTTTKQYAHEFQKILLNRNNDLFATILDFTSQFYDDYQNKNYRYDYQLNQILSNKTNVLIALGMLYRYLRVENTQLDKWGRIERTYTHNEIIELFSSAEFREFITFEEMTFFLNNVDLFEKHFN